MTVKDVRFTLSGRYVKSDIDGFHLSNVDDYRPFSRSEKSAFGSVKLSLFGGSLSTSVGYTVFELLEDDYSLDVRFSRTIGVGSYRPEIGSEPCRERVCQYDKLPCVSSSLTNK